MRVQAKIWPIFNQNWLAQLTKRDKPAIPGFPLQGIRENKNQPLCAPERISMKLLFYAILSREARFLIYSICRQTDRQTDTHTHTHANKGLVKIRAIKNSFFTSGPKTAYLVKLS